MITFPQPFPAAEETTILGSDGVVEFVASAVDSNAGMVVPTITILPIVQHHEHVVPKLDLNHALQSSQVGYTSDTSSPSSTSPPTVVEDFPTSLSGLSSSVALTETLGRDRLKWRLASGFFAYFMCGWGDGVTGTVLPYFMADFHVSFMLSSLLFVATTAGFVVGTLLVESIINQLGLFDIAATRYSWIPKLRFHSCVSFLGKRGRVIGYSPSQARLVSLLIASTLHGMFFVMMGSRGGFWIVFGAYAVAAFARSILTVGFMMLKRPRNAYFASGPEESLGYAFGLWSLGGVASPLLCQSLLALNVPWFKFYFGSLVLSAINIAFLVITFRPTGNEFIHDRQSAIMASSPIRDEKTWPEDMTSAKDTECPSPVSVDVLNNKKALRNALSLPYQWAVCLFSVLYCGCETTTQGFMVSYLLDTRNANPKSVGYVTSGFWGGITIGRFVWGHFTPRLDYTQRKIVVLICICESTSTVLGLTMQVLIWTVNSNVGDSVAASIIGLVYGPAFPASLTLANDILPLEVRMISMALISAAASFGSALFPFVAGTISSAEGVHTLPYITIPLAGTIACLWASFPSKKPHRRAT